MDLLELLRDCVTGWLNEADALLWMVLLHTHEIQLRPHVEAGAQSRLTVFSALTQREAAAVIASLWADSKDGQDKRADYSYWYYQYNQRGPIEVLSDLPEALRPRFLKLRETLARDSRVASLAEED